MFSVVGVVYMTWYDVQMSWNSSLYGGITSQLYSPRDVWYPILVLGNPFDSMEDIASNSSLVRVYSNGFTSFAPGKVFKTTCSADVTYFPFDKQVKKVCLCVCACVCACVCVRYVRACAHLNLI